MKILLNHDYLKYIIVLLCNLWVDSTNSNGTELQESVNEINSDDTNSNNSTTVVMIETVR